MAKELAEGDAAPDIELATDGGGRTRARYPGLVGLGQFLRHVALVSSQYGISAGLASLRLKIPQHSGQCATNVRPRLWAAPLIPYKTKRGATWGKGREFHKA